MVNSKNAEDQSFWEGRGFTLLMSHMVETKLAATRPCLVLLLLLYIHSSSAVINAGDLEAW